MFGRCEYSPALALFSRRSLGIDLCLLRLATNVAAQAGGESAQHSTAR